MTKQLKWRPIESAPQGKILFVISHNGFPCVAARIGETWRLDFSIVGPDVDVKIKTIIPTPRMWLDTSDIIRAKKVTR